MSSPVRQPSTREAYLRLPEVRQSVGLSKSTIYKRIGQGEFPRAYDLGGGAVAWKRSEIEEWMENRPVRVGPH